MAYKLKKTLVKANEERVSYWPVIERDHRDYYKCPNPLCYSYVAVAGNLNRFPVTHECPREGYSESGYY